MLKKGTLMLKLGKQSFFCSQFNSSIPTWNKRTIFIKVLKNQYNTTTKSGRKETKVKKMFRGGKIFSGGGGDFHELCVKQILKSYYMSL